MDNPFQETTIMLKWIWDPNEEWQDIIYLNRIVELSFKSPPLLLLLSQTPPLHDLNPQNYNSSVHC